MYLSWSHGGVIVIQWLLMNRKAHKDSSKGHQGKKWFAYIGDVVCVLAVLLIDFILLVKKKGLNKAADLMKCWSE